MAKNQVQQRNLEKRKRQEEKLQKKEKELKKVAKETKNLKSNQKKALHSLIYLRKKRKDTPLKIPFPIRRCIEMESAM